MTIMEYLRCREIGKPYNWKLFEELYPGSDLNDWRRGHEIIKVGEQDLECIKCFNKYQIMIIKIPDLVDIFEFEKHAFFEYGCMYCNYYIYRNM